MISDGCRELGQLIITQIKVGKLRKQLAAGVRLGFALFYFLRVIEKLYDLEFVVGKVERFKIIKSVRSMTA